MTSIRGLRQAHGARPPWVMVTGERGTDVAQSAWRIRDGGCGADHAHRRTCGLRQRQAAQQRRRQRRPRGDRHADHRGQHCQRDRAPVDGLRPHRQRCPGLLLHDQRAGRRRRPQAQAGLPGGRPGKPDRRPLGGPEAGPGQRVRRGGGGHAVLRRGQVPGPAGDTDLRLRRIDRLAGQADALRRLRLGPVLPVRRPR